MLSIRSLCTKGQTLSYIFVLNILYLYLQYYLAIYHLSLILIKMLSTYGLGFKCRVGLSKIHTNSIKFSSKNISTVYNMEVYEALYFYCQGSNEATSEYY